MAIQLAGRLREAVNARLPAILSVTDPCVWPTIEVGVGAYGEDSRTLESLLDAARLALDEATPKTTTETEAAA